MRLSPVGAVGGPLRSGESFTVERPPMIWDWDMDGGAFVVDVNRAVADGWRTEIRGATVVWLRELSPNE